MTAAMREGLRRVHGAPAVLLGAVALTLVVAAPGATAVDRPGGDAMGAGAVLDSLLALLDRQFPSPPVAATVIVWILLWTFLSGGILDRYARPGGTTPARRFFAACARHAGRLLRLGLLALAGYALLFGLLHPLLFDRLSAGLGRDVAAGPAASAVRAACYAVFGIALILLSLLVDYARIRLVVEERRSVVAALAAALRFLGRHPSAVPLYALNGLLFVALVLTYALVAPAAPATGGRVWLSLAAGQGFIVARHYLKLLFYASETAYFQGARTHAPDPAPAVVWPDSPVAEAIVNPDPVIR